MKKTGSQKIRRLCQVFLFIAMAWELCACGSTEESLKNIVPDRGMEEENADFANEEAANGAGDEEESAESIESIEEDDANESSETIAEQVLLEENGVKVTALEIVEDSIWGKGVKLLIENDSDRNIGIGCNALIVNDSMINDLFSTSVAAGKKANEIMYMSSSQLEAAGITNIGKIEIYFHIYDSDSYDTLSDPECIEIQTSACANMDSQTEIDGQELYAGDGIRIVGQYVDENSIWGTAVLLYIENTSGKKLNISCDDMSVNGYMVSPLFSSTIYDGKKAFDELTIFSSDLEENGIASVEEIEVRFHISDADTYETIADTEAISFHVN